MNSEQPQLISVPKWYQGGNLRHYDDGETQHIIFRLFDSVPRQAMTKWKQELLIAACKEESEKCGEKFDNFLDSGYGESWLSLPSVANEVKNDLLRSDGIKYDLHAWCIMPNHVHLLLTPKDGVPLFKILQACKSYTATACNVNLGRTGHFWARDYFDRLIRDENHHQTVIKYIENNPVKARLCASPEQWPYSSAFRD